MAPRIALALGAGGVVGHAYHAGVLAALEEATGWDPRDAEVIVGTSAGSVVGSLLRAGFAASRGDVVVVMMADLSDDPRAVEQMAGLVRSLSCGGQNSGPDEELVGLLFTAKGGSPY